MLKGKLDKQDLYLTEGFSGEIIGDKVLYICEK